MARARRDAGSRAVRQCPRSPAAGAVRTSTPAEEKMVAFEESLELLARVA
ncbi:MAG: hypothetical protein ACJ8BE_06155 [Microvirga sp.]